MSSATGIIGQVRGQSLPSLSGEDRNLLLVLPGLFLFSAFMFFPMVYVVYLSMTGATAVNLFSPERPVPFVWFDNYLNLFFAEEATQSLGTFVSMFRSDPLSVWDGQFWNSFLLTWLFVGISVVLKIAFSITLAVIVTGKNVRGSRLMRALLIMPMGLPAIFTISIWRGIFSSSRFGLLNQLLSFLDMGTVSWLGERWPAFMSYIVTEMWLAYPFMLIITASALQDVPGDLMDAAKVDGAGFFARFRHVTIPAIKRPVLFATILTAAASFQQVLIPYIFNSGGPSRKNELILVYAYREAFDVSTPNYGLGAAISITAILFIGLFMWVNVKKGRLAEGVETE